jgi:hypothetical protein
VRHAPTSRRWWRRWRPPADTRDAGKPVAEEHVLKLRKEVSRSKTNEPKPNTTPRETRNTMDEGGKNQNHQLLGRGKSRKNRKKVRINPVQSRLGFLRDSSMIY